MNVIDPAPIGDSCLLWSFDDTIDPAVHRKVLSLYRFLKEDIDGTGILDIVPAYSSLAVHFDPVGIEPESVVERVNKWISSISSDPTLTSAHYIIPAVYDGVDLASLADAKGLTPQEVIDAHTSPQYTTAFIGFLPHFPYLMGMDPRLSSPRLSIPRKKVPAGSVGIGGSQTGIYPMDSPGGWHLIGRSDPNILKFLRAGDTVSFEEVDEL